MKPLRAIIVLNVAACGFTTLPPLPGQDAGSPPALPVVDADVPEADAGTVVPIPVTMDAGTDSGPSAPTIDATLPTEELELEIGVPDAITGLEYAELPTGGDVEFSGGGQAGLAISLAVRCRGAGEAAHISATVTHLANDTTATRHERTLPDPLACHEDGWCTLLPVRIGVGKLGEPGEVDGAEVTIEASVRTADGRRTTTMTTGVLRRR